MTTDIGNIEHWRHAFRILRRIATVGSDAAAVSLLTVGVIGIGRHQQWVSKLIPTGVGLFGAVNILAATLPDALGDRVPMYGLLAAPDSPVTRTIEISIGMLLIICGRGLSRRSRRACWTAIALMPVAMFFRIIDGFNTVSFIVGLAVLFSLFVHRTDFAFAGDPTTREAGLVHLGALVACALSYGVVALLINRIDAHLAFHLIPALRATLESLLIGAPRQANVISGGFSEWFPWTLRAIVGFGVIWAMASWFAPWQHRPTNELESQRLAKQLVAIWGQDTLAPFTLRKDKALYFFPENPDVVNEEVTLIAFRVVRGVALVSGDPIGPQSQTMIAFRSFQAMCTSRGWQVAVIGASERFLPIYRQLGLRALYHGDEALIDVNAFSLGGGTLKSVRQAVNRVARKGYQFEICRAGELTGIPRAELMAFEESWRGGEKRKGFVMELDELFRLDGDDAIFVIGRSPAGELVGFLELAVCPASSSLSLSAMPRSTAAPNGLNSYLIAATIDWARENAYQTLSLNFSPAARLLDRDANSTGGKQIARRLLYVVKHVLGLQLDNLLVFNRHFAPRWQPRYVVIDRIRHLPRVVVAAMAAERYLPFAEILRGRDRTVKTHEDAAEMAKSLT